MKNSLTLSFIELSGFKAPTDQLDCGGRKDLISGPLEHALTQCKKTKDCKAVIDWACQGDTYYLCYKIVKPMGVSHGCIYQKGEF